MNITLVFNFIFTLLNFLGGPSPLLFQSLESKTTTGQAVFNEIKLTVTPKKDIWFMKQSHYGRNGHDWDEVMIVVYRDQLPLKASYHQLKDNREIEYKTSCFRCHSGGPRLIRPDINSREATLTLKDKLSLIQMNARIKSYGEVLIQKNNPFKREVQFVGNQKKKEQTLQVKSCTNCHYEGGPRALLTKENILTMKFLLKEKQMPPWPHTLSPSDKKELQKFIYDI